jgi:hypothetical protein
MPFVRDTYSVQGAFNIHNKPPSKIWEWTSTPAVPVTVKAQLPSTSTVGITLGAGGAPGLQLLLSCCLPCSLAMGAALCSAVLQHARQQNWG